jgi:hypothetical protein
MTATIRVTEKQALAFRARRHHLLGRGAASPEDATRAVVGIQAQMPAPALWSLAMRCARKPTAAALQEALGSSTTLVRTWGQRDTVHLYDAAAHWRAVIAGLVHPPEQGRASFDIDPEVLEATAQRMAAMDRPVTRSDLFELIPDDLMAFMTERMDGWGSADRAAAGRLIWALSKQGRVSAGEMIGAEQSYVLREKRYPELEWPDLDEDASGLILMRGYLGAFAPATVQDAAHFLGLRVPHVRRLVDLLGDGVVPVECTGRPGLRALTADADDLARPVPSTWRPRLLPKYDTLLMGHADKSWTVPIEGERPAIWAKAAHVNATVLDRGRLVATWKHTARAKTVIITIAPLSGWRNGLEEKLDVDAGAFARHLGVAEARIIVAS